MPWDVRKKGAEFCVYKSDTDEEVACHDTREAAERQMAALYAQEPRAASDLQITFDDASVAASFRADVEKRTISGLLVPYGPVARSGGARWRFGPRSLRWADVSRVKLNLNHERREAVGVAVRLQEQAGGVDGTFKIARGPKGDQALSEAVDGVLDGFSIELDFEEKDDGWAPDPSEKGVRFVKSGKLAGVALTAFPSFDDARVDRIAAARLEGGQMENQNDNQQPEEEEGGPKFAEALADLAAAQRSTEGTIQKLGEEIGTAVSAGFRTALEEMASPQASPQAVRSARFGTLKEPPVYLFNGAGESIVRDAWSAIRDRGTAKGDEASDRLTKFRQQQEEVTTLLSSHTSLAFAPISTSGASQIIPPGYRPDLYVGELNRLRPLISLASRGSLSNATPFTVPVFSASTGGAAPHVEGTNPSDGTLTFTTRTVTPAAKSGRLVLTREMVDSSNPAIDQIAFATMREDYARDTEADVYTLLNGANGAGGTISSGFVPSGAQASTTAKGTDNQTLIKHLRDRIASYYFARFAPITGAAMGPAATSLLATAVDTTQRPLFPFLAGDNAFGGANANSLGGYQMDTVNFTPAWAMTGVAAGDSQIFLLNRADLWVWESPLLSFRYDEKQGPANIELNIFGYFGVHLLRPVGLSGIRIT